ncbi:MAG: hypothetical protein WCC87_19840 [Candidatus Korobacteraceae bacterium]
MRALFRPDHNLIPKTANCNQPELSSLAAAKDTTLSWRMRGTYEGFNGLSLEFYPDSAIVGCGKAAHAYPYIVRANGRQAGWNAASTVAGEVKDPQRNYPRMPAATTVLLSTIQQPDVQIVF